MSRTPSRKRLVRRRRRAGMDTECTGTNVWTGARPFAVSGWRDDGVRFYREVDVDPRTRRPRWRRLDLEAIREFVAWADVIDFFNLKFDRFMLGAIGVEVPLEKCQEVSFMARCVNNLELAYKLKPLAKKYVEMSDVDEKELHDATVRARRLAKKLGYEPAEEVEQDYWMVRTLCNLHREQAMAAGLWPQRGACEKYAVRDAERTFKLGRFYEYGMGQQGTRHVYEREMDLLPVTIEMEEHGACVDLERMAKVREQCLKIVDEQQAILDEAFGVTEGEAFNINSHQQIAKLLFGGQPLSLPVLKRTKTKQPKTDAEALAPHKQHPLVQAVFKVRANKKASRDFFDKYERLGQVDDDGNFILHPGCNQWGTLTGRYSMKDPNLHAVSDPDTSNSLSAEFMVDIRQVFVPRPGYVWYCPDYSQVEVIIFASISGEPTMVEAIRSGQDVHGATCEKIWSGEGNPRAMAAAMELLSTRDAGRARALLEEHGWSIGAAEKSLDKKTFRKKAKSVTFTKIFGGGPLALMRWIGVSKPEAKAILNAYDDSFPTMVERMREIENRGKRDGFILNSFGRRLEVDPWNAYRAVNHHVQSDAADLMKMGMRKTARYLKSTGLDARILLTIHDELIFEFKRGHDKKRVLTRICELMADHEGAFAVPTPVDIEKVEERWSDKTKVDLFGTEAAA